MLCAIWGNTVTSRSGAPAGARAMMPARPRRRAPNARAAIPPWLMPATTMARAPRPVSRATGASSSARQSRNGRSRLRPYDQHISGCSTRYPAPSIVVAGRATLPELAEPRPGTKGNADRQSTHRTQSRARVTQALDRVRKAARQRKKEQFTSLLHHMDVDLLRTAFYALKRKAAPGVDGMMWADYEADLEPRLEDLHGRVHRGAYRSRPSRRTYIPKADGKQRPLAIAALEDKIVQGATVMLLNAIYEDDFCGFSYGFRPGPGPHDALDALSTAIKIRKVNWILDADIQNFFGAVSQEWLVVVSKNVVHLIRHRPLLER